MKKYAGQHQTYSATHCNQVVGLKKTLRSSPLLVCKIFFALPFTDFFPHVESTFYQQANDQDVPSIKLCNHILSQINHTLTPMVLLVSPWLLNTNIYAPIFTAFMYFAFITLPYSFYLA